jgi:hypothetical protein
MKDGNSAPKPGHHCAPDHSIEIVDVERWAETHSLSDFPFPACKPKDTHRENSKKGRSFAL